MDSEFCDIESFNPHDETINFGSRAISEGNKLYEAVTLCCLKIKEFDHETSTVKNLIVGDRVFLCLGRIFIIFDDRSCSSLIYRTQFDNPIDSFAVKNNYVLICFHNGSAILLNIETSIVLKKLNIIDDSNLALINNYFIDCFVENSNNDTKANFLLITNKGTIYRVVFDISEQAFESKVETVANLDKRVEVAALCNNKLLLNGSNLTIYDLNDLECIAVCALDLKCAYPNHKNFIGLLNNGTLVMICSESLLFFPVDPTKTFKDLFFFKHQGEEFLFVVTEESSKECNTKLINLSELSEPLYEIGVNKNVYLFHSNDAFDEQLCLSSIGEDEWRIQKIWENEPEKRLERLLRKELFQEAEEFAKTFNLDPELILKARAKNLLDKSVCDKQDAINLIELLDKITDVAFKLDCCLNITFDTFEDTRKFLLYGAALHEKNSTPNDLDKLSQINETLYRFDTFTLLNRHNQFEFDYNEWNHFCNVDLLHLLCQNLRKCKNIEACIILYCRLDVASILQLTLDRINEILQILGHMSSLNFIPFSQQFIPNTLMYFPSSLPSIVNWICQCVFNLERKEYENFPENAIEFLNKMILLLKTDERRGDIDAVTRNEIIGTIFFYKKALNLIEHFNNNFSVVIPLKECLGEPVKLVSVILLENSINVDDSIMSFLVKYLIDNNFDPNKIFFAVIEELIIYEQSCWINDISAIWGAISNTELKLNAILLIMEKAKVPWSENIHIMIKQALELKHKLSHEVEKKLKQEPIYVVLKREKYMLKTFTHDSICADMECKAIRRIIYCYCDTMEEDVLTLCTTPLLKAKAARFLLEAYIKKSNMNAALKLINRLNQDEIKICYQLYKVFLESDLWLKFADLETKENLYNVLNVLAEKSSAGQLNHNKNQNNSNAILQINKKFNMQITHESLSKDRNKLLDELLMKIVAYIYEGVIKSSEIINCCLTLSNCLKFKVEEIIIKLCDKCSNLDVIHACINYLYETSNDAKVSCQISVLLLRYDFHDYYNAAAFLNDSYIEEVPQMITQDINLYKTCLSLAKTLILKCESSESIVTSTIFNWIDTALIVLSDIKFGTSVINTSSTAGLEVIRFFLNLYIGYLLDSNNINYSYFNLSYDQERINQSKLEEILLHKLQFKVQNLSASGNSLFVYKLVLTIKNTLIFHDNIKTEVFHILTSILSTTNLHLLEKVFASKIVDEDLAFSTLLYFKPEKEIKILKQALTLYKTNPEKFKKVAKIGLKIFKYHRALNDKHNFCHDLIILLKWWKLQYEKSISQKDFFLLKTDQVLEKLIEGQQFNITQIQEFCADFKLNVNSYYIMYLKQLLINGVPEYTIEINVRNKKYPSMKTNDEDLFEKCMNVIKLIKNKDYVLEFMNTLWGSINVYHYEVFICVLNIVSALGGPTDGQVRLTFLHFLINYTRVSKPGECEREMWFTSYPNSQHIDPLSEWRLPFTPILFTNEVWNILTSEVTLETYSEWFRVLNILTNLKKDDICTYAVKEIVRNGVFKSTNDEEWVMHPRYTNVFIKVDLCLQNISDLERATSVAYHLMMNTPKGADQVNAAKLCYKYAIKYKEEQGNMDGSVLQAVNKVEMKYHNHLTTQILYINNLALPQYLELVAQPNDLIEALYSDERIIKTSAPLQTELPDINKAVDDIAKLYGINILSKRTDILESYLTNSSSTNINLDETIRLTPMVNLIGSDVEEINFNRASYICLSENPGYWQDYLIEKGLSEDSDYTKYDYRGRALKCLIAISSQMDIEGYIESLHSSYQEFLDFVDKLFLLHYLQCYGMNIDLEDLQKYNKKKLLLMFAKDLNNPIALKIMMSICFIFNITELKYWEVIIRKLIEMNSVKDLKKCLFFLKEESIFYKKFYLDAWQTITNHSLQVLINSSKTEDIQSLCIQHLLFIQSCPVLLQIDLRPTFDEFIELERYDMAAVVLQYFSESKISICIKILLQKIRKDRLISSIQRLFQFGIVGSGLVMHLLDSY